MPKQRKSKYQGVFKTNEHGYEYWIAQLTVKRKVTSRRCVSEEHAAREYDRMRMQNEMKPINFPEVFTRSLNNFLVIND